MVRIKFCCADVSLLPGFILQYMEDKAEFKKPKLALVRGDTYGEWDSRSWRSLADDFDMTVFCSKGNSYNKFESGIPVKKYFPVQTILY